MNIWKPIDVAGKYGLKYAPRLTSRLTLFLLKAMKETIPFTPFELNFPECRAALVTTTGVHLESQQPFDTGNRGGDPTYREIPSSIDASELMISHGHYDQADAEKDINVIFPIERMRELVEMGVLGSLASKFYAFMGFVLRYESLERKYAPEVAARLAGDSVDLAILTPG